MFQFLVRRITLMVVVLCALASTAYAQLEGSVTRGRIDPIRIAIPGFAGNGPDAQLAADITRVIEADLERSGLFQSLDREAFIQRAVDVGRAPNFNNWRVLKAQALVVGRVTREGNRVRAEFRLWDVFSGRQLIGQQFAAGDRYWRRVAHRIADAIYERMTGEKGYFDTQVVFVDETGGKRDRRKRIAIMDQDGANLRYLTEGRAIVIKPRFNPSSRMITYTSYESGQPRVYLLNLDTGRREIIGRFPNMSFAPRFSPDGGHVIMSLIDQAGITSLFEYNLRSRQLRQLTRAIGIDTEPSYSPDGRQIVFASDRAGGQQLFVMNSDGSNIRRISEGGGSYATPVWSPRGDLIAFTKQTAGRFLIGVMRTDGSGERILTSGFHNEGPTWAPNGRVLMFFRESRGQAGGPRLYTIDLTGYNERPVRTPSFGSDPAWSPLIN